MIGNCMYADREYLALASYCGGDKGDACTKARPCGECLAMCNVFKVADPEPTFLRDLGEPAALRLAHPAAPQGEEETDGAAINAEARRERFKGIADFAGPVVSFDFTPPYYLASCDSCGWVGSSEACGTDTGGDDSDVYCPRCHASGADCGKVAAALAPAAIASGRGEGEVGLAEAARDILEARTRLGYAVHDRIDLWERLSAILQGAEA